RMDQSSFERQCGVDVSFDPETQTVKTPGSCPSQQRTKSPSIDQAACCTKARGLIVSRQKTLPVPGRHILPVSFSGHNERLWIMRPKFQSGNSAHGSAAFANTFPGALNAESHSNTGGVIKLLRQL